MAGGRRRSPDLESDLAAGVRCFFEIDPSIFDLDLLLFPANSCSESMGSLYEV